MWLQPFYGSYEINDDALDCWKIIVVECDGRHVYKDVCELIEDCQYPITQLEEQCVVDFLNNLDLETPWNILRISAWGCLESVDPAWFFPTDPCTVKVDSNDWCGYLEEKLVACVPASWPYIDITKIWSWASKQLQFCINGFSGIDDLSEFDDISAAPSCDDSWDVYVKVDKVNNKFEYTCEKKYFCQRNAVSNITCDEPNTGTATFFFTGFNLDDNVTNHPDMLTGGAMYQLIKAPKTWYYHIRFNTSVDCYFWVGSFRCFLWKYDSVAGVASIVLDRDLWTEPQSLVLPNSVYPAPWLDADHFNQYFMSSSRILFLNEWDSLGMWTRVSTSTVEWVGWKIVLKNSVTAGGNLPDPPFPPSIGVVWDQGAITNFWMSRYTHE